MERKKYYKIKMYGWENVKKKITKGMSFSKGRNEIKYGKSNMTVE
jgi:hypothetical protein